MRGIIPAVTVTPSPGWWNGRHSRLKSGGRKACGFDSRPGHVSVPVQPDARKPRVWWWFLVPLLSFGVGSFVMVLLGGLRLRSRANIGAAVGYFLLLVYFFVAVQYTPTNGGSFPDAAVFPAFLLSWLGGTAHVLALQSVIRGSARPPVPPPAVDPALAAAGRRAQRREEARAILATKPALAAELRIGRPDLTREYDDGGLVDVNHVPAEVLVRELDMPDSMAATLVAARSRIGGFSSAEELVVYCDGLTPDRLNIIRERLAFVPM